jgi:hypothetical protein
MSTTENADGHTRALVVDSDASLDRIDYQRTPAVPGERAVPYHCPYCAEEDLRPLGATPGAWHCRTCTRTFSVKYLGMQSPADPWPPAAPDAPEPIPTGGPR